MLNVFRAITLLQIISVFSCKILTFEPLESSVTVDDKIAVSFSQSMNESIVEDRLQLKKGNSTVQCRTEWKNNTCCIEPLSGFDYGQEYTFSLKGDLLTEDGRHYDVDLYKYFIYGEKNKSFMLLRCELPAPEKNNRAPVILTFNKPVSKASFENVFEISPFIELNKEYCDDCRRVVLSPKNCWQNKVFYTWKVTGLFSEDSYKINKEYSESFIAVDESDFPEIVNVFPLKQVGPKEPMNFVFNRAMNYDSVKNGISISPSISGYWENMDSMHFVFFPYNNYEIDREYLITIDKSVTDSYGIKLENSRNLYFKAGYSYLKIEKVFINGAALSAGSINTIKVDTELQNAFMNIVFSSRLSKEFAGHLSDYVMVHTIFPDYVSSPQLSSICFSGTDGSCQNIEFNWKGFLQSRDQKEIIYELKIIGGRNSLKGEDESYLKEDICYYFKVISKD